MKDLIIETDLGRDPDDFFALLYLAQNYKIRGILLSPGDPDQVALARGLMKAVDLTPLFGSARLYKDRKLSVSGWHRKWMERHHVTFHEDDLIDPGDQVLEHLLKTYPQSELFICGPPKSITNYLALYPEGIIPARITLQGGFVSRPYLLQHGITPSTWLEKFGDDPTQATFNLGGCAKSYLLTENPNLNLSSVGKNVCHTLRFSLESFPDFFHLQLRNSAQEVFQEGMRLHLDRHAEKAMHDPLAAVLHHHPEIGLWVSGQLYREKGKWGTRQSSYPHRVLADVDRPKFWHYLFSGQ